ncbi:MAG: Gfo/Idh/MocA family oxidoreductase [Pirellulaceae bacterium]|nr:Gfo/Idh/MocA family oxidoreductase [Pirellulaceae bacterium]
MPRGLNRRTFLTQLTTAAACIPLAGASAGWSRAAAPSDRLHLACVGVGGKGWSDMLETSVGQHVVALCDVDQQRLAKAAERFPQAKTYTDWRKLLEQKDIDALTVSTPDHTHAPVSLAAISLGKHVYTQKPLTHSVFEARQLTRAAAEQKVVTQMGIQHHSSARLKTAVEVIRQGTIGPVSEVHVWTDRPGSYWKQGLERPATTDSVPAHLDWDLWLGVAPQRPYVNGLYHPFHWRGWWDFGTGALGDMGCHLLDPVVHALQLGPPSTIAAEGPPPHAESGPLWCIVSYEFPGTRHTTDRVKVVWYEAGKQPDREMFQAPDDWPGSLNGVLFVGAKGNLFVGFPEPAQLFPAARFADYEMPRATEDNHYTQWTAAILGQGTTSCPFEYSGPLTETVLLGNVAYRTGKTIHWDSQALAAKGVPEAGEFVRRAYRPGWEQSGKSS